MAVTTVNEVAGGSSWGPAVALGPVLQAAAGMYEQLKGKWNHESPNLSKCSEELGRLKLVLLELNFLPTTGTKLTKQQLILPHDILEIGAQWSKSAYMHQLLGLNLVFLLSQHQVAEFHTELEWPPAKDIQTNVYIKQPVSLEQYLMEGSYNKVFLAKGNIPVESCTFFIDILFDTIRDEIAGCIEKAYEKILFTEATRILFFNTPKKMTDYARKRGWILGLNNYYSFVSQQQNPEETTISSSELAKQVIKYTWQLEMIVWGGAGLTLFKAVAVQSFLQ
uniref:CSN8/PSMD8/EIF3K domain-containing protein n=1 Tax=Sus scrofa TaxID=9823 RepID=A0A8D1EDN6_PIG